MRILCTYVGGTGHVIPLLCLARAARDAGHTVAFAGRRGAAAMIEAAGCTLFPTGPASTGVPERRPLLPVDIAREERDVRERFARRAAREQAGEVIGVVTAWKPDLLVCDELDFGSMVVAEKLGLPHVNVLVVAAGALVRPDLVAEPLHELRAAHDLPFDPDLTMLSRYLVLSPFPPSYRDPRFPLPATAHSIRPLVPAPDPAERPPDWLSNLPTAPTVYFTLGTAFNLESGDLFSRVIAGLRDLPINLIVTVGSAIDPAEFGVQPANVRIERYIPQSILLPRCDLSISHGGSGSVMGALVHGVPMVVIPLGADQPHNAGRCAALGVARVLDPVAATPEDVRDAVETVLSDDSYRTRARALRDEIAVLPGPDHAVTLLEQIVATHPTAQA